MNKPKPQRIVLPLNSERVQELCDVIGSSLFQATCRCRQHSRSHSLHCYYDGYVDALHFVLDLLSPHVSQSDSDSDLPF